MKRFVRAGGALHLIFKLRPVLPRRFGLVFRSVRLWLDRSLLNRRSRFEAIDDRGGVLADAQGFPQEALDPDKVAVRRSDERHADEDTVPISIAQGKSGPNQRGVPERLNCIAKLLIGLRLARLDAFEEPFDERVPRVDLEDLLGVFEEVGHH
jgi:hypothetical protein